MSVYGYFRSNGSGFVEFLSSARVTSDGSETDVLGSPSWTPLGSSVVGTPTTSSTLDTSLGPSPGYGRGVRPGRRDGPLQRSSVGPEPGPTGVGDGRRSPDRGSSRESESPRRPHLPVSTPWTDGTNVRPPGVPDGV